MKNLENFKNSSEKIYANESRCTYIHEVRQFSNPGQLKISVYITNIKPYFTSFLCY